MSRLFVLSLVLSLALALSYHLQTTLQFPIDAFLISDDDIIVGSQNTVMTFDSDGNLTFKATMNNASLHVQSITMADGILVALWSDHVVRLWHPDRSQSEFVTDYSDLHYDEGSETLVMLSTSLNRSTLNFVDLHGKFVTNYTVPFRISDLITFEGLLFFDSLLPITSIDIATIEGVVTHMKTDERHQLGGLALNDKTVIAGGSGLSIYNWNGTFITELLRGKVTVSPQVYNETIAFFSLDNSVPVIPIIDMQGNVLDTLVYSDHQTDLSDASLYFTSQGNIIARNGDQIKIFSACCQ